MSIPLSPLQWETLTAFLALHRRTGAPPSLTELGSVLGLSSKSGVRYRLDSLRQAGVVAWTPHADRTLHVIPGIQVYLNHEGGSS